MKPFTSFPYSSPRGHLLATNSGDVAASNVAPQIAVELYEKWYHLFVIFPGGRVETFASSLYENGFLKEFPGQSAFGDHIFNPLFVLYLAKVLGYEVAALSLELLIGRWELEGKRSYPAGPEALDKAKEGQRE